MCLYTVASQANPPSNILAERASEKLFSSKLTCVTLRLPKSCQTWVNCETKTAINHFCFKFPAFFIRFLKMAFQTYFKMNEIIHIRIHLLQCLKVIIITQNDLVSSSQNGLSLYDVNNLFHLQTKPVSLPHKLKCQLVKSLITETLIKFKVSDVLEPRPSQNLGQILIIIFYMQTCSNACFNDD